MSSACGSEEVFYDSVDQLVSEDLVCGNSDYDMWLSEPDCVIRRRKNFLSRMGFVESSTFAEVEANFKSPETVSSHCSLSAATDDALLFERQKSNSEANCSGADSDQDWLDHIIIGNLVPTDKCEVKEDEDCVGKRTITSGRKTKKLSWLRRLEQKMKKNANLCKESKLHGEAEKFGQVRVEHNQKRYMECTAVYAGLELKAHDNSIRAMKFSPDGQYLASGCVDGVVCIWRVDLVEASSWAGYCSYGEMGLVGKKTKKFQAPVVVPEKIFHIQECPLHKFQAHSGDVLDLAWSPSNHLLSSSVDNTVCLWRAGSDRCLGVFHHTNYVTCVEFNPVDENLFISGSIDGKVRIWGVAGGRVKDWADVQDIVTAVCYQPNGKGFVVGSVSGSCRFYDIPGDELVVKTEINVHEKRKSSGNRITGIQFLKNGSQRVMITSEGSKIHIVDGLKVVCKYKGLPKSGCQLSASLTSSGRHIVSVGEDSRVYLWAVSTFKQRKRSCETFLTRRGVSLVLPWSGPEPSLPLRGPHKELRTLWGYNYSNCFSLSSCFSTNGRYRACTTWPEERLPPLWDLCAKGRDESETNLQVFTVAGYNVKESETNLQQPCSTRRRQQAVRSSPTTVTIRPLRRPRSTAAVPIPAAVCRHQLSRRGSAAHQIVATQNALAT
ncbi:Transducin/WD40 repeat-like superfamily protein [Striga hermonthica]|uniref:Transducin/WD40 repeat-like superfamily protein n=1 Tax=Striga hermonthica TaxID=68872 RepID=A0A9N7NEB9_STRHE|nr:Transducin/WD40 repeat-like superfamily protein [Striga hermonthica]